MEVTEKIVRLYLTNEDESPFQDWFEDLRDKKARGAVLMRIARLRLGNLGDWESVGEGVCELRIHYGPGFRVYFAQDGADLVLLLCGGDKSTQKKDIKRAQEYWYDYQERKKTTAFGL